MEPKAYKVTCEKCKKSDVLKITPDRMVMYTEHLPIISARFRPDMNWGFECICGQDSRVAPEERDQLEMLVKNSTPNMIKEIAKSLTPQNNLKFRMELI
jgi:hypothetical protein